jgi:hypothetical protein
VFEVMQPSAARSDGADRQSCQLNNGETKMTTSKIALVTLTLLSTAACSAAPSAQELQGRPGVIRNFEDKCFRTTDIRGEFWDNEIPCDDRYKDAEEIAE